MAAACTRNDHHRARAGRRWVTRRFSSRRSAWTRRLVRGRLLRRSRRSPAPVRQRRPRARAPPIQRRRWRRVPGFEAAVRARVDALANVQPPGLCQGPCAQAARRPVSATRPGLRAGGGRAAVDGACARPRPEASRLDSTCAIWLLRQLLAGSGGVSRRDGRGPASPARRRPRRADAGRRDRHHRVRLRRACRRTCCRRPARPTWDRRRCWPIAILLGRPLRPDELEAQFRAADASTPARRRPPPMCSVHG